MNGVRKLSRPSGEPEATNERHSMIDRLFERSHGGVTD